VLRGWGATGEFRLKISVFAATASVWPKISGRRGRPPPTILHVDKTRINVLSRGVKIPAELSLILLQSTRLTDGQTEGLTNRRTAFSWLDRCHAMHAAHVCVCACVCVGRRVQYCQGFLDVHGRWNNGFYCRRRRRANTQWSKEPSQRARPSSQRSGRLALHGGCCGNDTYRFCCDVTEPSFRHHQNVTSTSSSSSSAAAADNVHGYQSVRSAHY